MAGIYFHIPFCKSKCNYCDFFSVTSLKDLDVLVASEISELLFRKNYIGNEPVSSIYFGGGTPSLLSIDHIAGLLKAVYDNYFVVDQCEITLEANPEDLSESYLLLLYKCGVNRLSIGVQSFNDDMLRFLGRRHDSSKLNNIISSSKLVGFNNISVDLIFGIPGMSIESYISSVNQVLNLGVQHISVYSLTIEKGTYFYKMLKNKMLIEMPEEFMIDQFNATIDLLEAEGFLHYEISNFARDGFISRHNSSYWKSEPYLGVGPSAHSYNGHSRQWNVSSIKKYCLYAGKTEDCISIENLSVTDKYNEYLLTGLRTSMGISSNYITDNFPFNIVSYFNRGLEYLCDGDLILISGDNICLTRKGMLISDYITRKLYYS